MSVVESSELSLGARRTDLLVKVVQAIRHGGFTKGILEACGGELVSMDMTVRDLVHYSIHLGNLHWENNVLKLADKTVRR